MNQIKVPLTPREWAEKRLQLICANCSNPSIYDYDVVSTETIDNFLEICGFYLVEETEPETKRDEIPTDKVEAVKYFLNQLPDGYKERALAQVDEEQFNRLDIAKSIPETISAFSVWTKTNEGGTFWYHVYSHYENPTQYPTLPPLPNE